MDETFVYEPIDLCACYEPFEEPPADLMEEWERLHWEGPEDTPENRAFYLTEPDGAQYYYYGNTRIKVSEHFAAAGKPVDKLIENVIVYAGKNHGNSSGK